jgi:hypothetical protein
MWFLSLFSFVTRYSYFCSNYFFVTFFLLLFVLTQKVTKKVKASDFSGNRRYGQQTRYNSPSAQTVTLSFSKLDSILPY